MASLYASVAPQFTRELLSPGLRVGYTDEGGVWQFLAASLCQRLPLRAIEWRNLVGVTKRIEQLPLHFVERSSSVHEDLPLACLYLVKCEDLDSYKTVVRGPLVSWVDAMSAAKVEWLVLYVPLGTRPKAAGNAPNPVYRKIFERLRADFAHRKGAIMASTGGLALQERVCKIDTLEGASVVGQQQQHESQWTELLLRLKHCIMDAFQIKCFQYEEQLRVLDARRNAPGWDFGAFFLAKERLALMYQQMYLQDDAIRHLDELDAIFINLNKTEKEGFCGKSKNSFTSDDRIFTVSPLALNLYETQLLIASNRASARLISLYCFCRQIRTLYLMGSFPQLLQRATAFIATFLVELEEMTAENVLEWHQPFMWAVGACLEVTYACELSWSGRDEEWTSTSVSVQAAQAIPVEEMSRALGDLLYLARRLLKVFTRASKSRSNANSSRSDTTESDVGHISSATEWYQQLEQIFMAPEWQRGELCEPYERFLSEISHLASMHFSQSGRHRFAVFLGGQCAHYHLARGEFESASRLLRSLARQSKEDGWWSIYGDCARSICRAEMALGRSRQAVAACFSMLQLAQEEQVGVSKEEIEQLMHTLVASLHDNGVKSGGHNATPDADVTDNESNVNMGELFRPTVTVETTQTSGIELEHGDIRVTLGITNDFSVGVHLEKIRVRFARAPAPQQNMSPVKSATTSDYEDIIHKDSAHLDDLALDEETKSSLPRSDNEGSLPGQSSHMAHKDLSFRDLLGSRTSKTSAALDKRVLEVQGSCKEHGNATDILLEESNVDLGEKTGVTLIFLHSGVPVGRYICTGIECVLAGNTFHLLPPHALELATFGIVARESTVQVAIDGAPLLIPQPSSESETVMVSIAANEDVVSNGILELRVFKRGGKNYWSGYDLQGDGEEYVEGEGESTGEEECGIQFTGVQLHNSKPQEDSGTIMLENPSSTLSVRLPTLRTGGSLTYIVSLAVLPMEYHDYNSEVGEGVTNVVITAKVRYQRDGVNNKATATTELRCAEANFRVLQPLAEIVRLKRVGTRIFMSVALTCNSIIPITLRNYKLLCPGQGANNESLMVTVEQDPNTNLNGTKLRPRDCIHLAFTLACSPAFEKGAGDSFCTLQLSLSCGGGEAWHKTMAVLVSLAQVEGKCYRIDVIPKALKREIPVDNVECSASEPVTFHVNVQEVSQHNTAALEDDAKTLMLCLNESSERDWVLMGKELEQINFRLGLGSDGERRRHFSTQKRLMATHAGQLRFPGFRLEINGQAIPAARVHCQQASRRVLVT